MTRRRAFSDSSIVQYYLQNQKDRYDKIFGTQRLHEQCYGELNVAAENSFENLTEQAPKRANREEKSLLDKRTNLFGWPVGNEQENIPSPDVSISSSDEMRISDSTPECMQFDSSILTHRNISEGPCISDENEQIEHEGEWHEIIGIPSPQGKDLSDSSVQDALDLWIDPTKREILTMYIRHILEGGNVETAVGDFHPRVQISGLSGVARESMLQKVIPLLLWRRGIEVSLFTRERIEKVYDMRIKVAAVQEDNSLNGQRLTALQQVAMNAAIRGYVDEGDSWAEGMIRVLKEGWTQR